MLLAPRPAYANSDSTDELQTAGLKSEYVIIDVVRAWETGFMVVDITKPEELESGLLRYPPVSGATVTVTSRFNGQTTTGTTDDYGVVNLDIRALSVVQDGEDVNNLDDYHFNGEVTVEKDGWRKFETALIVVQGGEGLQVPAHPLDESEGTPYPRLASFDEWDGLYCVNDFLVTPANDIVHEVGVSLLGLPNEGSVTVELWVEGEKTPRASVNTTTGGKAEMGTKVNATGNTPLYGFPVDVTFEAPFLKAGDAACLPVGGSLKVVATQGDTSWSWPLAVTVSQGVVDEPAGKQGQKLSPINTITGGTTGVGMNWPDSVPIIGGGALKFWAPELPIDVFVNPFGMVQITLKFPSWGYKGDTDSPDDAKWGKFPRKSVEDQWAKKTKAMRSMTDKTSALVSEPGAIQQIDLFKSFSLTVNFQLLALAKWDSGNGIFQGEVGGQILGAFNFTITENFFAGPIPVLITFSLDANLIFGLMAAAYSAKKDKDESLIDAIFDFSRWTWDYKDTGLTITMNITPALSVGVGIRGVASISVKGAITLTLFFGVPMGTQPEGLPAVHFAAGWSALISLVIELFLFTESFALYNKKFENFYDNWDSELAASQAEAGALNALANLSLGELLDALKPITDEMLAMTSEASVDSGVEAQGDADAQGRFVNWNELAHEKVVELGDGTSMTFVVYDLGSTQDAATQDATTENEALPVISWLQAEACDPLPELGIASLGVQSGVCPSSDVRLFGSDDQHVLSAAHIHALDIGAPVGKTQELGVWCFRIAAVQVNGQPRTRIIANCIDGNPQGTAKVIEFDTNLEGMPHADLYDYDFDVMVREEECGVGQTRSAVFFVILSGKRDNGGDVALASASTDLVITHLWLDAADFVGGTEVLKPGFVGCFSMQASDIANVEPGKPHCISNLKIANCPKEDSGYDVLAIMFLDRYADTAEEVLGDTAHVCIGALMVRRMADIGDIYTYTVEKYPADWWHDSVGDIDSTVYEAEVCPTTHAGDPLNGIPWFLMLRGANNTHYIRTVLSNYNPTGTYVFEKPVLCGDFDPSIRMVWCSAIGGFLTSYPTDPAQLELGASERNYTDWALHKATWSNETTPKLQLEPIGPSGFNVVNFAVRDSFLFWPSSREADEDRVWDANTNEDVTEREPVYQLLASRMRGDRFSDPFVVADLSNDTDMLSVISVNDTAIMEGLRTVYVDTGERGDSDMPLYHAADIWYTAVPAVCCATAIACEAEVSFVSPGGNIDFRVSVRNDGNTFLSGCTLKLCAYNDETQTYDYVPGAESWTPFSVDTIRESTYNQSDGQGGYTNVEPDYALAPGKTSVYAVTVTVPSDWPSGEKKVLFVATDGQLAPDSQLSSEEGSEPEPIEFHIEPGEYKVVQQRTSAEQDPKQRYMDTLTVSQSVAGGMYFQSAATVATSKGNNNGNSNGSSSGSGSTSTRNTTARTGDSSPSTGLGLAGAALTAVGVALAAYERRRAESEDL